MTLQEPFPSLDEILASIGQAGLRVSALEASEGAAGNISVCAGWPLEVRRHFPLVEHLDLPEAAPALASHRGDLDGRRPIRPDSRSDQNAGPVGVQIEVARCF